MIETYFILLSAVATALFIHSFVMNTSDKLESSSYKQMIRLCMTFMMFTMGIVLAIMSTGKQNIM